MSSARTLGWAPSSPPNQAAFPPPAAALEGLKWPQVVGEVALRLFSTAERGAGAVTGGLAGQGGLWRAAVGAAPHHPAPAAPAGGDGSARVTGSEGTPGWCGAEARGWSGWPGGCGRGAGGFTPAPSRAVAASGAAPPPAGVWGETGLLSGRPTCVTASAALPISHPGTLSRGWCPSAPLSPWWQQMTSDLLSYPGDSRRRQELSASPPCPL